MAKQKLPPAQDWRSRDIADWNATTFRSYLSERHTELYGISYVTRSIAMEAKMIKRMIDDHGPEVTKEFIDRCFAEYRPTPQYPSINFAFMYIYMKERTLPNILAEQQRKQRMIEESAKLDNVMTAEEIDNWL